ncbi:MAG: YfhO family protein [Bacteroidota bacterium]
MNSTFKKYLPHATAIVVFALITLVYFRPLLSGKELKQDDIARAKGMSKEIADFRSVNNSEPLWTNSMFGGMPAYLVSTLYPGNWIGKTDRAFKLFLPHPGGYLFLYCLGFFILLLCLQVNPWLALIGGVAYGLSSYFLIIIEAGHNSKANALGYLPALVGGIILLFRGKYWQGLAVTALFTAMELNANHVQISYYGYILIAFIIAGYFYTAFRKKELKMFFKAFGFFCVASFIGLLPNAASLLSTNEYGKLSTRSKTELTINSNLQANEGNVTSGLNKDYATQWSYGIGETFTFLIPDFKGGPSGVIRNSNPDALKKVNADFREQVGSGNAYFGDQPFTSGPVYIGAIIVFLALLGLFVVKNAIKWPVFLATLLTIALSWGNNFMGLTDFFMNHVPGYNKFRAVSMILVIAELTIPLLAILAVNEILKISNWEDKIKLNLIKKEVSLKKLIIISASVVGGFCLLGYLVPDLLNTFHGSNEEEEMIDQAVRAGNPENQVRPYMAELMPQLELARKAIFKSDAIRSLIFIFLGFGVLYLYFTRKINKELLFTFLGVFIVIDLWTVDARYLDNRSFVSKEQNQLLIAEKTTADEEILKDNSPDYRVLNLNVNTFNDASTSYYHKSVGGYHGAKLKKYAELIDFHIDKEIDRFYKNANKALGNDSARAALLGSLNVLNMLNTRYIILPGGEGREALALKNDQANGNAWFIKNINTVNSADSEIVGLYQINTKTQAIARKQFKDEINYKDTYSADGKIALTSYQPNHLVYETDAREEEFAVFSEIYYPKGWNAYVDGQLRPHIGVDYVLRGMIIPAGRHKVEFRFEPATYKTGNLISVIGSILLILTIALSIFFIRKNNVIVS